MNRAVSPLPSPASEPGTHEIGPKTVVILGMFRSGTSLTAAILNILGVDFGENLLPGSRANPLGYFEDLSFMNLNRSIVREAGGSLHEPPPGERILAQETAFRQAIAKQVRPRDVAMWGWKDPAASLTIGLYAPHLVNPSIIICRRDARAVAESYGKMVSMSIADGMALWSVFNERIDSFLAQHRGIPALEIQYEALMQHPERCVDSLIDFLGLHPTQEQRAQAMAHVLPRRAIQKLRAKSLLKSGLERPWKVPAYVMKRVRNALRNLFLENHT